MVGIPLLISGVESVNWLLLGIAGGILLLGCVALVVYLRSSNGRSAPSSGGSIAGSPGGLAGGRRDLSLAYDEAIRAGDFPRAALAAKKLKDSRRYAEALERGGDVSRAVAAWIDTGEHHRAADLLLKAGEPARAGRLYVEIGALSEALSCFEHADEPEMQARVLRQLGDPRRASLALGEALARKGEYLDAAKHFVAGGDMLKAAQQLMAAGDLPKAVEALRRGGRSHEAARMLAAGGDHASAARLYEEAEHFSDAARQYRKAGDPEGEARCLAQAGQAFEAGRRAYERQEHDKALEYLGRVRPLDPLYPEAALLRGQILQRHGELKEAADAYTVFLDDRQPDEKTKLLYLRVAELREGLGQMRAALNLLGRLITAGLGTPDVTEWAARLEQSLDEEAEQQQTRSMGQEPPARARSGATRGGRRGPRPVVPTAVADEEPPGITALERRYKFLGRMGQGGNGVVYRAVDKALGRNVVVKFLHQALLPTEVARKYFRREAKTAASLNHPNIVTIFDVGEEEGTLYFSMELVEGRTLADLIVDSGGLLNHQQAMPVITQLCSALDYAHGRQVIHRDIKPGNIMITDDGTVKLLDFGLAKALDENPDKSVFLCGTPFYMSPEQIRRDFLDHRTDIYSLGCLLYVIYTGDVPFPEGNVFQHQQKTPAPHPDELVHGLPPGVGDVLLKAVDKDRERRWQRATQVAEALAACG